MFVQTFIFFLVLEVDFEKKKKKKKKSKLREINYQWRNRDLEVTISNNRLKLLLLKDINDQQTILAILLLILRLIVNESLKLCTDFAMSVDCEIN